MYMVIFDDFNGCSYGEKIYQGIGILCIYPHISNIVRMCQISHKIFPSVPLVTAIV